MPALLNIALLAAISGFFIFTLWYTAYRLHVHFNSIPFLVLQIAVAFDVISAFVASSMTMRYSNTFVSVLNILGGWVLLFYVYLFILLTIAHIASAIWKLPLERSGMTVMAAALIVTTIGAVMGATFFVNETEVEIPGLEKELTIMLISDVHLGHHRGKNYLTKIVEATNSRNPDLVLIAGDLVDAEPALLPGVLEPLSDFKAPVYFIEGNHEEYMGSQRTLKIVEQQGVRVMRNEMIETNGIQLVGLEYMKADNDTFDMHPSSKTDTVKSVLGKLSLKNDVPTILMHHSPVGALYADAAGVELMLSGHTHGGQIFPFSLLSKLSFPLNRGMYQHGNTKVFTSVGAGTFMIRARLGSFNEINQLKLVPGNLY